MARKREVLSVTVTAECIALLNEFVDQMIAQGWATNKSMVVNNAVIDFIKQSKNEVNPSLPKVERHDESAT